MKKVKGLQNLISMREDLPEVGWIFVEHELVKTSVQQLEGAMYYIAENDEDEFYGEDNLATWLEAPTFLAILELREKNLKSPELKQYAEATVHYLEEDDFLE